MQTSLANSSDAPTAAVVAEPAHLAPEPSPAVRGDAEPATTAGSRRSDIVGIGLTAACAIHCLATPLIALLPLGSIFASHTAEWLVPAGAALLGLAVIRTDYRKVHRHIAPTAILGVAALLMAAGHALDDVSHAGTFIALAGNLVLAVALLVNLRIRRRHCKCHAHPSQATTLTP